MPILSKHPLFAVISRVSGGTMILELCTALTVRDAYTVTRNQANELVLHVPEPTITLAEGHQTDILELANDILQTPIDLVQWRALSGHRWCFDLTLR